MIEWFHLFLPCINYQTENDHGVDETVIDALICNQN